MVMKCAGVHYWRTITCFMREKARKTRLVGHEVFCHGFSCNSFELLSLALISYEVSADRRFRSKKIHALDTHTQRYICTADQQIIFIQTRGLLIRWGPLPSYVHPLLCVRFSLFIHEWLVSVSPWFLISCYQEHELRQNTGLLWSQIERGTEKGGEWVG